MYIRDNIEKDKMYWQQYIVNNYAKIRMIESM